MVNVPPGYQLVPAPAAPPQIQKSANGVNFQSVLAANPALAYQVGAGFGSQPFQTAMSAPMQRMPSWSAPGALGPMTGPAYGQPTYGQPVANYGQQPMQGGYNMPYNRGPFGGT